jgi:hypothetical protein
MQHQLHTGLFTAVPCRLSRAFFLAPCSSDMASVAAVSLIALVVLLTFAILALPASAWNMPGHMLSAAITYQVLQAKSPQSIEKAKAVLEKHPWYANQWQECRAVSFLTLKVKNSGCTIIPFLAFSIGIDTTDTTAMVPAC